MRALPVGARLGASRYSIVFFQMLLRSSTRVLVSETTFEVKNDV